MAANKYAGTQTEKIYRRHLQENLRQKIKVYLFCFCSKKGEGYEQMSALF